MAFGIILLAATIMLLGYLVYSLIYHERMFEFDGLSGLPRKDILIINRRLRLFCQWIGAATFTTKKVADGQYSIMLSLKIRIEKFDESSFNAESYQKILHQKMLIDVLLGYEQHFPSVTYQLAVNGRHKKAFVGDVFKATFDPTTIVP